MPYTSFLRHLRWQEGEKGGDTPSSLHSVFRSPTDGVLRAASGDRIGGVPSDNEALASTAAQSASQPERHPAGAKPLNPIELLLCT